jgi:hypothetical protein
MKRYRVHPELTFVEQEDGSWIAMGRAVPIFVAAPSRSELDERLAALEPSFNTLLLRMADGVGLSVYLTEHKIPFEPIDDDELGVETCELAFTVSG